MFGDSNPLPLPRRLELMIFALVASQRRLGFPVRFEALIPLTIGLFVTGGLAFTLPPGPLCDEGMVLFLEGGCDWGNSNIFFFAKLSLLAAVNLAWIGSWRRQALARHGFWPHLVLLGLMTVEFRSGGRCDSYYSHPNGSIGQMTFELACFAILGLALWRLLERSGLTTRALALVAWNSLHVGLFYLWSAVTPHWAWWHSWLLGGSMLVAALVVERAAASIPRSTDSLALSSVGVVSLAWRDAVSPIAVASIFLFVLNPWGLAPILGLCGAIGLIAAWAAGRVSGRRTACALACAAMMLPLILGLGYGAVEHTARKRACSQVLERAATLSLEEAGALRSEALRLREKVGAGARIELALVESGVRRFAERALADPMPLPRDADLRVLVPLEDSSYLFLWRTSSFIYCDVRALSGEGSEITGYDFIQELLAAEETHTVSLVRFASDRGLLWSSPAFYSGRVLRDAQGMPHALIIAGA